MADDPPAPKPAAPLTFNQKIAAAMNNNAQRADALTAPRQVESANDLTLRRLAAAQPAAQPAKPGTPAPTWDEYFSSQRGTVQPAAEMGAATSDAAATAPGAAPDPSPAPPSEADLVIPASAAEYKIELPADLPQDIEVNESYTNQIREFAAANGLNQGFMTKMVAAVVKNDLAKIAADKAEFTRSANAVVAAVGADRIRAVGSFLDRSASTPEAANALKAAMRTGGNQLLSCLNAWPGLRVDEGHFHLN